MRQNLLDLDGAVAGSATASRQERSEDRPIADILRASDVLDTLDGMRRVDAVILDPWYNKGVGGERDDYHDWLGMVIAASCRVSDHVFVWGFPEILAHQVTRIPAGFKLLAWLTWYYRNCPSVIRGWRSA